MVTDFTKPIRRIDNDEPILHAHEHSGKVAIWYVNGHADFLGSEGFHANFENVPEPRETFRLVYRNVDVIAIGNGAYDTLAGAKAARGSTYIGHIRVLDNGGTDIKFEFIPA